MTCLHQEIDKPLYEHLPQAKDNLGRTEGLKIERFVMLASEADMALCAQQESPHARTALYPPSFGLNQVQTRNQSINQSVD